MKLPADRVPCNEKSPHFEVGGGFNNGPSNGLRASCKLPEKAEEPNLLRNRLHTGRGVSGMPWRLLWRWAMAWHRTGNKGPRSTPPPPLCDIPSGCCSFTGPAEQRVGASAKRHRDPCYPSHGRVSSRLMKTAVRKVQKNRKGETHDSNG